MGVLRTGAGNRCCSRTGEVLKVALCWGTWVVQSVKHPTSAQVMISLFVSSSPASGSVLTAQSLELLRILCLPLSLLLPPLMLSQK